MDPDQPRSIRIIIRKTEGVVFIVDILPFKGNISPKKKTMFAFLFLTPAANQLTNKVGR